MSAPALRDDQYWHPYVGGAVLGVVLFTAFLLTGSGLGGSGGLARLVAAATDVVAPAYVDTNPVTAPWAGGDHNPLLHPMVFMTLGVVLGGFISGLIGGRVKFEIRRGPHVSVPLRLILAFSGGTLAGFAARLARGCTSGQALTGGAVLSAGSWAFMIMVLLGAYLLAWPLRRMWN